MRALPRILERRPNARAVIVGGDKVSLRAGAARGEELEGHLPRRGAGPARSRSGAFRRPRAASGAAAIAAGVGRACLPDLSVRAVVVDARGDERRRAGHRLAHALGRGGHHAWPQRHPVRLLRCRRHCRCGRGRARTSGADTSRCGTRVAGRSSSGSTCDGSACRPGWPCSTEVTRLRRRSAGTADERGRSGTGAGGRWVRQRHLRRVRSDRRRHGRRAA